MLERFTHEEAKQYPYLNSVNESLTKGVMYSLWMSDPGFNYFHQELPGGMYRGEPGLAYGKRVPHNDESLAIVDLLAQTGDLGDHTTEFNIHIINDVVLWKHVFLHVRESVEEWSNKNDQLVPVVGVRGVSILPNKDLVFVGAFYGGWDA